MRQSHVTQVALELVTLLPLSFCASTTEVQYYVPMSRRA